MDTYTGRRQFSTKRNDTRHHTARDSGLPACTKHLWSGKYLLWFPRHHQCNVISLSLQWLDKYLKKTFSCPRLCIMRTYPFCHRTSCLIDLYQQSVSNENSVVANCDTRLFCALNDVFVSSYWNWCTYLYLRTPYSQISYAYPQTICKSNQPCSSKDVTSFECIHTWYLLRFYIDHSCWYNPIWYIVLNKFHESFSYLRFCKNSKQVKMWWTINHHYTKHFLFMSM